MASGEGFFFQSPVGDQSFIDHFYSPFCGILRNRVTVRCTREQENAVPCLHVRASAGKDRLPLHWLYYSKKITGTPEKSKRFLKESSHGSVVNCDGHWAAFAANVVVTRSS